MKQNKRREHQTFSKEIEDTEKKKLENLELKHGLEDGAEKACEMNNREKTALQKPLPEP